MTINLFISVLLVVIGLSIIYFKFIRKEPRGLIPKFSWQDKKETSRDLLEFKRRSGKLLGEWLEMPTFWPRSLAIRGNYLYASDYWDSHIQIFKINPDGSLSPQFIFGKKGEGLGEFDRPQKLMIRGNYLYVTDTGTHNIQVLKINPDGSLSPQFIFGKKGEGSGEFFSGPDSLVTRGNYLYVTDAGTHNIQVLKINPDGSLSPQFIFGKKGEGLGEFNPGNLLVKENCLYVADDHNRLIHILKINPDGSLSPQFIFGNRGKWGKGLGEFFSGPDSLAIRGSYLYVTDAGNHHIQIFKINPDGSLSPQFIFGKKGEGLGEFDIPQKLMIRGNYLYVTDTGTHNIQVLKINPDGSLSPQFIFGKKGEGLGEFFIPNNLLIRGNYLYVSDAGNDRIETLEIQYK